jgi:DNA repair exonuclease SbcCD ATPase subunit
MFLKLKLTNFRQHTDLTIDFAQGLVALRGLNEAGKTTVLEAIAYAMFGWKALREALEDVVTWGAKVSTLKVELDAAINGVTYHITRGKSGAEITFGGERITGQDETRKFVENLLGVSADVAAKMMLANQASLRGALQDGPTKTSELIEGLADFDLIDRIIHLIEERLPSGNTTSLEGQVAMLSKQVEESQPAPLDLGPLQGHLATVQERVDRNAEELLRVEQEYEQGHAMAEQVREQLKRHSHLGYEIARLTAALAEQSKQVDELATAALCQYTQESIDEIRKLVEQQAFLERANAAWKALQAQREPADVWEGDRASFEAEKRANELERNDLVQRRNIAYLAHQSALGRKINEKSCAFCKKDLSDVPEVARLNAELDAAVAGHATTIRELDAKIAELAEVTAVFDSIELAERGFAQAYGRAAEFIDVIDDRVPARWRWSAGDPSLMTGAVLDRRPMLREAEAELQRAARAQGQHQALMAAMSANRTALADATTERALLEPATKSPLPGLDLDLCNLVQALRGEQPVLQMQVKEAMTAIRHAHEVHEAAVAAHSRAVKAWNQATLDLQAANFHNGLIRKLRAARPKVADELWSIVLSSVSHYFSQIRGVKSAVTRSDKSFQVDGRGTSGLSGSTLDALGLAIRIALTKTFLPNARFMVLDEPAAACDDSREANMLGLVSACDFDQVLLVTHSDLADAYAAQVVSL